MRFSLERSAGTDATPAETAHMAAAVFAWRAVRFDLFCVNPPLTRIIGGLPVVLLDPKCDSDSLSWRPEDRREWAVGQAFIAANSPEKTRWSFTLARWSLIPLLLLGGYFGLHLTQRFSEVGPAWCFWSCGASRRCSWPGARPSARMQRPRHWALWPFTRSANGCMRRAGRGRRSPVRALACCR